MATVAAKKPSRAEAGHLLLEGKTAIHRFRAAGKVRATMRAGAMQCRAHAHDAVTKDFQKKHLPKASCSGSDAWVAELARPGLHLYLEGRDVLISRKGGLEVFELLTLLILDLDRDLAAAAEEAGDRLEVLLRAAARRHGRRADAHATGGQSGRVSRYRVLVQGDRDAIADLLDLGAREAVRPKIPQDQVVVCAAGGELVALLHQGGSQGRCVLDHALRVLFELWRGHLQELTCQTANLMIVGASLQSGEHGHIDPVLDVRVLLRVLEEDHAGPRPAQRLVRRGRHNVSPM